MKHRKSASTKTQQRTQALVNASAKEQACMRKHQSVSGKLQIKRLKAHKVHKAQSASGKNASVSAIANCEHKHTSLKRRAAARQRLTPTRQHNVARNEGVVSAPGRQPSLNSPVQKRQLKIATANTKYKSATASAPTPKRTA